MMHHNVAKQYISKGALGDVILDSYRAVANLVGTRLFNTPGAPRVAFGEVHGAADLPA